MTRSVRNFYSTDETGAIIPLAEISVNFAGGAEAPIYTSNTGGVPVTQPLISTASGKATFYIEPGVYDIASQDPISLTVSTFVNEEIGASRASLTKDKDVDFYFSTTEDLINHEFDEALITGVIANSFGYSAKGIGGAEWQHNGVTGQTPSQSPAQLGDALLNDANGNQWELVGNRINLQSLGLSESNTGEQNDLVILAAINSASVVVSTILPDKIDQVNGSVYLPSGRFNYTEMDIPDGILIEGDSAATSILVDTGTDTARASIEVGSNARESHRNGLYKVGLVGAGVTDRNGVNFNKSYRLSGLFECDIDGFYDNVTGDTFAISFVHNRIYSAVRDNFSIVNGTAITFERNRIEIAGRHNVYLDGQQANEPINVSFNQDKIQSAQGSAISGIDCLSVEINDCFFEANNQAGGFTCVEFVGGTAARDEGIFKMTGGFMSPGSGQGGEAIHIGNMKMSTINPCFIRGGAWDTGIRFGSSSETAEIFGIIDVGVTQVIKNDRMKIKTNIMGFSNDVSGETEQKQYKRIRATGSSTDSQDIDSTILLDTSAGGRVYTVLTADIEAGRQIKVQKTTNDANNVVIDTEGAELVNGAVSYANNGAYVLLTITSDGTQLFVG